MTTGSTRPSLEGARHVHPSKHGLVYGPLREHQVVPLRPRQTPGSPACPDPSADAPGSAAGDRAVLSGMAEHARSHSGLRYVAVFRHAAGSHTVLEELARASMLELGEMERVRAAGHAAVRGMRRFARRAVTLEGGVYVVAAEMAGGEVVSVVASGAGGIRLPAE